MFSFAEKSPAPIHRPRSWSQGRIPTRAILIFREVCISCYLFDVALFLVQQSLSLLHSCVFWFALRSGRNNGQPFIASVDGADHRDSSGQFGGAINRIAFGTASYRTLENPTGSPSRFTGITSSV